MGYEEQNDFLANMNAWQRNKLLKIVADMAEERKATLEKSLAELDDKIKLTEGELEKVDTDLLETRRRLTEAKLERDNADKLFLEFEKNPEEYERQQRIANYDNLVKVFKALSVEVLKLSHESDLYGYQKLVQNKDGKQHYVTVPYEVGDSKTEVWESLGITHENIRDKLGDLRTKFKNTAALFEPQRQRIYDATSWVNCEKTCKEVYEKYMNARHDVSRCEEKLKSLTEGLRELKSQQELAATELEEINA